jgi:Flp pilus assembly secretin CpaC
MPSLLRCRFHSVPALVLAALLAGFPLSAQEPPSPQPATPQAQPEPTGPAGATQFFEQGLSAERAGDWEAAWLAYSQAVAASPADRAILVRREIARFQVVQQRTERARGELLNGQRDRARATLRATLQLDPTYAAARDLLEQVEQQRTFAGNQPPLSPASGPPEVVPATGTRSFDYRGPTRGAYEEIARQFGLSVAFDTDLSDRELRFRVTDVDFQTAMDLLSQQTATFWVALDARRFFVAQDTLEKRRQFDPQITVSIPLPASESTDDMTETTRVLREMTGIRRSVLDTDTHMLTVRDTPQNIAIARQLLLDIDQPRGELMLDIDLLEVNRDAARRLGITPPTQARMFTLSTGQIRQLEDAQNNGTLAQVLQSIFGTQNPLASGTNLSALIPPLIVFGGGNTTFLSTLPGATADFSRTVSVIRQAQRILLRAKDGQPATFFVGERFPITLALLSSSLVSAPTQFTPGILPGAFPRTDFPTGTGPAGLAAGDFDGDDDVDLAAANQTENTVSILLGDGQGSFGDRTDFTTGAGPVALAAGDFDRDGNLDLAVADDGAQLVTILRGAGDGTFAAGAALTAGNNPSAILSDDFDRDGLLDLVVANRSDNTISIFLGNGDGTFAARQNYAVGNGPLALAAGDFDNDGNLDLAVANQSSNTVSLLEGAGDGTFLVRTDLAAGNSPSAVAVADFDGDGRIDLAVANQSDDNVSVLAGNGDGTFGTRTELASGGGPTALLAADFNSDQVPDLVTADQQDNSVSVFLSLGDGSFAERINLPVGNAPVAMVPADLNGDNRLDLIVSNRASNNVTVTLNTTDVPVSPNAPLTSYPASEYVDIGLKISATPRIHLNNEVTLRLQFEISALTGQDVNGIPIIGNRSIEQMVRLRENQTSVLAGMIQSTERKGIVGWPGTAFLGARNNEDSETELLIAITPRRLRLTPRKDHAIYAGRGEGPPAPPEAAPPAPAPPGGPVPPVPPVPGQPPVQPGALPPGGQAPPQPLPLPPGVPDTSPLDLPPETPAPPPLPPAGAVQGPG